MSLSTSKYLSYPVALFCFLLYGGIVSAEDKPLITPDMPQYIEKLTDELLEVTMADSGEKKIIAFMNILTVIFGRII